MKRKQTNMDKLKRIFEAKQTLLAFAMMLALPALILCQTNGKNADKKGGDEQAARQTLNDLVVGLAKTTLRRSSASMPTITPLSAIPE